MNLGRPPPARAIISLVPLVDVLLILLVFFMVTSTYLNLDMIPAVQRQEEAPAGAEALHRDAEAARATGAMVVRIGADNSYFLRGQPQSSEALASLWRQRAAADPSSQVLVLPSPRADLQALVTLMDTATAAGISRLSVIRLEAAP